MFPGRSDYFDEYPFEVREKLETLRFANLEALTRVVLRYMDAAIAEKILAYVSEAQVELGQAKESNDVAALARSLDLADTGLELLEDWKGASNLDQEYHRHHLLNIRGRGRIHEFYLHAQEPALLAGLSDLRTATSFVEEYPDSQKAFEFSRDLVLGLVSAGEQYSDKTLLKEAARRALDLMGCASFDELDSSKYILFNAYSIANLRIGTYNADSGLVEKTARQLRAFLVRPDLLPEAKVLIRKSTIMSLLEHARQRDKKAVYLVLIEKLSPYVGEDLPDQDFYLHYRATSQIELGGLSSDPAIVERGIDDLNSLLKIQGITLDKRLTTLQSLAQAYFRIGKMTNSKPAFEKNIFYLEGILRVVESSSENRSTMIPRVLSGIGSAQHALGILSSDTALLAKAERNFQAAQSKITQEASPWLHARATMGLFLLLFHQRRWEDALIAFGQLDESWEIVVSDRKATSEIHSQRAVEMAGHYARAALCHLELGAAQEAFSLMDRGRTQNLQVLNAFSESDFAQLSPDLRKKLEVADGEWRLAQRSGDDEECRFRRRLYLDLLREAGLDQKRSSKLEDEMLGRIPPGGALVLIFSADQWVRAIVASEKAPFFHKVPLAPRISGEIGRLLRGSQEDGKLGWEESYQRFVGSSDARNDSDAAFQKFNNWSDHVGHGLQVLGQCLMEPIRNVLVELGVGDDAPVVLLPPGELAALPLANAELSDGSFFADCWPISVSPCLDFINFEEDRIGADRVLSALVVSPEEGASSMKGDELPYAAREGAEIAARFPNEGLIHLRGKEAGVESVLEALPRSSVVHFSCHGKYEWKNVQQSRIELPDGSSLSLAALHPSHQSVFQTRLITLSCCETGISGQSMPPEEFEGILPALLHCGAQGAIGSLWPVYDDAAMLLTLKFYECFLSPAGAEKCQPSVALAEAQSWLRNVTIGELVDDALMTSEESIELAEARFQTRRLRIRPCGEYERNVAPDEEADVSEVLSSEQRGIRPYASPVDWAAFVLVGS